MRVQLSLEWVAFTRSLKNRILFILATIVVAVVFIPKYEHIRQISPEAYRAEIFEGEYLIRFAKYAFIFWLAIERLLFIVTQFQWFRKI